MSTVTLVKQDGNPTFSSLIVNGPTNLNGSFNTNSSLNVSGSIFASGSLVISGSITAQSLIVNTTTYSSGSNVFGNSPSNTQVFTGSMYVEGLISGSVFYGSGANLIGTATSLNIGGNAGTATTLQTSRNIYGNSFNGSADITSAITDTYISSAATWNAKQAALSGTGFVKISGTTISYDNSTYLTGNQTITLSGDISGTGATAITTTIGASKVTNAMLAGSIASSKLVGTDIATVGTITSGTWNGTAIGDTYISSAATWNGKQPQLNGTGFVKATGTTISYDNSTYITGNQTITLSGDISGTGATAITTTIGASKVTNAMLAGSINYSKMDAATVPTWNQNTTGNAATATAVVATVTGTNSAELVRGNMADNDQFRILVGGTATNAGYVEIATADDATEPIYVRQYTGVFSSLTRTATLLDGSGNTSFPGTVSATFSGNLSGNASTATSATSATSATTAVNLSGLGIIQSTSTGTSYTVNYQVRENSGGGSNTNEIYAPQLAFHWGGVVASSIMMEASGRIAIRNNPGTSYENFIANIIYANSSFQGNLTGNVTGDVSGNATTAGGLVIETGRNNNANRIVRTDASGYIQCGYINSSNGNENNNANADRVWGTNGSDDYLRTYRTSALSVSYAASAGSAGSATTATTATFLNSAQSSTDVTNISSRVSSGFFQDSATQDHTGWPSGASSWYHLISSTHSNPGNYYALQFAAPFFAQGVYTRNTNNNGTQAWALILTTGNYTSYVVPSSGGTFTGNVTINGSSNTPLSMNSTEPYMEIVANGGSNTAGIAIKPTTGYDAAIGNYRGGALNLIANSNRIVQVTNSSGVIFYVGSHGPVTAFGNNTSAYYILVNESSSNKTWDITLYNNDFYINESGIASRLRLNAGGGLYADFYSDFSDIRYKNILETNPVIDLSSIDVISYTRKNDSSNRVMYGYSAQQVQTILPSAVVEDDKEGMLSVIYNNIHVLKIAALERKVQDLQTQINNLKQ